MSDLQGSPVEAVDVENKVQERAEMLPETPSKRKRGATEDNVNSDHENGDIAQAENETPRKRKKSDKLVIEPLAAHEWYVDNGLQDQSSVKHGLDQTEKCRVEVRVEWEDNGTLLSRQIVFEYDWDIDWSRISHTKHLGNWRKQIFEQVFGWHRGSQPVEWLSAEESKLFELLKLHHGENMALNQVLTIDWADIEHRFNVHWNGRTQFNHTTSRHRPAPTRTAQFLKCRFIHAVHPNKTDSLERSSQVARANAALRSMNIVRPLKALRIAPHLDNKINVPEKPAMKQEGEEVNSIEEEHAIKKEEHAIKKEEHAIKKEEHAIKEEDTSDNMQ